MPLRIMRRRWDLKKTPVRTPFKNSILRVNLYLFIELCQCLGNRVEEYRTIQFNDSIELFLRENLGRRLNPFKSKSYLRFIHEPSIILDKGVVDMVFLTLHVCEQNNYSTVTDFAKLRGQSTLSPFPTANQ